MDFIYAHSGILYEIISNTPRSNFDPKFKPGLHVDEIVGSTSAKIVDSITNQMNNLFINKPASGQATTSSHPTQTKDVLSVQSLNQKGNHQPGRNKKKGKNNRKGFNRNDNANNDKNNNNVRGDKKPKHKVKFPCNICRDDHLTHLFSQIEDALKFILQSLAMFTNPLLHNQI